MKSKTPDVLEMNALIQATYRSNTYQHPMISINLNGMNIDISDNEMLAFDSVLEGFDALVVYRKNRSKAVDSFILLRVQGRPSKKRRQILQTQKERMLSRRKSMR